MATKKELALLPAIFAAMQVEATPYAMMTAKEVAGLVKDGLVEQNPELADGDKVATRLTEKGIEAVNTPATTTAPAASAAASAVNPFDAFGAPDDNIPVPTVRSRSGGGGLAGYIDSFAAGQSKFFPNTEEKPNMAKSLASTVSTVLAKHATPVNNPDGSPKMETYTIKGETKTRQAVEHAKAFTVASVTENGVAGARIWRTK